MKCPSVCPSVRLSVVRRECLCEMSVCTSVMSVCPSVRSSRGIYSTRNVRAHTEFSSSFCNAFLPRFCELASTQIDCLGLTFTNSFQLKCVFDDEMSDLVVFLVNPAGGYIWVYAGRCRAVPGGWTLCLYAGRCRAVSGGCALWVYVSLSVRRFARAKIIPSPNYIFFFINCALYIYIYKILYRKNNCFFIAYIYIYIY